MPLGRRGIRAGSSLAMGGKFRSPSAMMMFLKFIVLADISGLLRPFTLVVKGLQHGVFNAVSAFRINGMGDVGELASLRAGGSVVSAV